MVKSCFQNHILFQKITDIKQPQNKPELWNLFLNTYFIPTCKQCLFQTTKLEQKTKPLTIRHKVCTISNSIFFLQQRQQNSVKNYFIPHICRSTACQPPFNKHFPTAKCCLHIKTWCAISAVLKPNSPIYSVSIKVLVHLSKVWYTSEWKSLSMYSVCCYRMCRK